MKTLEVRCCCAPQKLLGWVDVDDMLIRAREIRVAIPRLTRMMAYWTEEDEPTRVPNIQNQRVSFRIEEWWDQGRKQGLAVKAEGYTADDLETLLRTFNFRSAA